MSDSKENVRRWSGYVCPECRFVFRVSRDHEGQGVVCPNCRNVLRVPQSGDRTMPLVVPLPSAGTPVEKPKGEVRRKKRSKRSEEHAWESSSGQGHRSRRREGRQMLWMSIGGASLFMGLIVAVLLALLGGDEPEAPSEPSKIATSEVDIDAAAKTSVAAPEESFNQANFVREAEPIAKEFLNATTVEQLLPMVIHPDLTESRMRRMYSDGKIEKVGLSLFNSSGEVKPAGSAWVSRVRTGFYEEKPMAFVRTPDGLKIDWESWVGWSEMSLEEFVSSQPSEPQTFRVTVGDVDYYNFGFKDDEKWKSYRLVSPDGEQSVYGYVERNSILNSKLRPDPSTKERGRLALVLKFPKEQESRNQVIIEEMAADGWVLENELK